MPRRVAPERPAPPVSLRERDVADRSLDDAELFLARASKEDAASAADVCAAAKRHQRRRSTARGCVVRPRIRGRIRRLRLHVVVRLHLERLAPTDALLPQLIERAHRHGARHPLQPPNATRLDVDDQTHPSLQQQLPREPRHRSLHHEDVRADGVYPGHRPAQVLVLLVQQRVQRREPRRRVGALVLQRPPQEDHPNVAVANRGHALVRHVLGEHLPAPLHHPALVDAPARDLLATHVRARVHPTGAGRFKKFSETPLGRHARRRDRRQLCDARGPRVDVRSVQRVFRVASHERRPRRVHGRRVRAALEEFIPGRFVVPSVRNPSPARARSRPKRRIPQRLEDRPPRSVGHRGRASPPSRASSSRARHGDGGDGGGGGGGSIVRRRRRAAAAGASAALRAFLLLLRFLLIFIVIVVVVVVGFRGWNGVAVGPSPPRVPRRRSQELRGGARREDGRPARRDVSVVEAVGRGGVRRGVGAARGRRAPDALPAVADRGGRGRGGAVSSGGVVAPSRLEAEIAHPGRFDALLADFVVRARQVERAGAARAAEHLTARAAVVLEPRQRSRKLSLAPVARLDHALVDPEFRPLAQEVMLRAAPQPRRRAPQVGARPGGGVLGPRPGVLHPHAGYEPGVASMAASSRVSRCSDSSEATTSRECNAAENRSI